MKESIKKYLIENRNQVGILIVVTILAYGYFITTWTLSIDSELASFSESAVDNTFLLASGRFFLYLLDILHNNQIIPFWNGIIAVSLIFLSAIIWCTNLTAINSNKRGMLIFSLIFTISPIYAFYLQFTTYNISVSFGLLLMSIAAYYFSCFLGSIDQKQPSKKYFIFSLIPLFLAISIYRVYVPYWITSVLLIINYKVLTLRLKTQTLYKYMGWGLVFLVLALVLYQCSSEIIYCFIAKSNYPESYFTWRKQNFISIANNLLSYSKNLLINYHFNFFLPFTLIAALFYFFLMLSINIKNLFLIFTLVLFTVSIFLLPLILGTPMPLRTLQNSPLWMAGMWLIIHSSFKKKIAQNIILVCILISTFFNAQFLVRIFYGDHMRLQHDIHFANQLYNFILNHTGTDIYTKPLVIIGRHPSPHLYPFIIKSDYDTIGFSFFQDDGGNNDDRKYRFMMWLGLQTLFPTPEQEVMARKMTVHMGSFPNKNSINATKNIIVLKVSPLPYLAKY